MSPRDLDALIDKVVGRLFRDLLAAIAEVRSTDWLGAVERYLLERNLEAAVGAVDDSAWRNAVAAMQRALDPVREAGWEAARTALPKPLQADQLVKVSLPRHVLDRPFVQQALARADLSRIQGITTETQEAIRELLARGLREGIHPTKLARELRGLIGLNRQQVRQVANYRAKLEAQGRKPEQVERMVQRFADKKLRQRAETIARTETARAANEGQRLQWERLVEEGRLNRDEWEMEWITARDERTCPICGPLHGVRAPIGGTFETDIGPLPGPIAHPQCRCILRLVPRGFRAGESPTPARDAILRGLGRFGG